MSDMNVNATTPSYYKQSVPRSAIETGLIGAGVGAVSATIRYKGVLKNFVKTGIKSDEFIKKTLSEKQDIIKSMKSIRKNLVKLVGKEAGMTALFGIGIGALGALVTNSAMKKQAEKQA